jgi:tetratricopeptide (TPR) repeat protein
LDETTVIENDRFNKHFNKAVSIDQENVPHLMSEYIDNAYVFIKREKYDHALSLLNKAYGLSESISNFTDGCHRNKFMLFVMFHNMALCYQNQQSLEESASCMDLALDCFPIEVIADIEE